MSYIENNLMPSEKIIYRARLHPAIFLPALAAFIGAFILSSLSASTSNRLNTSAVEFQGVLLCIGFFMFLHSILLAAQAAIIMLTTEFAVTNRRIIAKTGFVRRHTLELFLQKVESVQVHQNILARLLNFGSVEVTGTGGTRERFRAIIDPIGVRRRINQVIEHFINQSYGLR